MLSAPPHDGKARSFASLMNMLDATAIADPDDYTAEDFRDKGLVIRRFKKDVQHQVRDVFRDRQIHRHRFAASAQEEAACEALLAVTVAGRRNARRDLLVVTLEKPRRRCDGRRALCDHAPRRGPRVRPRRLASVNANLIPLPNAVENTGDGVEREAAETAERALVHVAATRAKKGEP